MLPLFADQESSGISEEPIIKLKYCIPRAGGGLACAAALRGLHRASHSKKGGRGLR